MVWDWLRWLALVLTLYFQWFRAHLIRCLLLKSAFLGFVLIFGGAQKKVAAIEWNLDFAPKSISLLQKNNIEGKKTVGFHSDSLSNFDFHFWGFFTSNLGLILTPLPGPKQSTGVPVITQGPCRCGEVATTWAGGLRHLEPVREGQIWITGKVKIVQIVTVLSILCYSLVKRDFTWCPNTWVGAAKVHAGVDRWAQAPATCHRSPNLDHRQL